MKLNQLVSMCAFGALAFLPASAAAAARECIVQQPTPASYTWNFQQETNNIFKDVQFDAQQALYNTGRLQRTAWGPDSVSWTTDAVHLNRIGSAVNDMSGKLCRLETIRRAAAPWQQRAIDRIAFDVKLLADNTQDAIAFGSAHRETLWVPAFQKDLDNMYTEAHDLTQSVGYAVQYTKVDRQDRVLRKDLNVRSSS